jgi:dihydrofolate reductase
MRNSPQRLNLGNSLNSKVEKWQLAKSSEITCEPITFFSEHLTISLLHKKIPELPYIALISACGLHGEIGDGKQLLWHLPQEFQYFKALTLGHSLVMGRKTWENLPPLKDRRIWVLSRTQLNPINFPENSLTSSTLTSEALNFFSDVQAVLDYAKEQHQAGQLDFLWISGGEQIYKLFLPLASSVFLTHIEEHYPAAKTFFPTQELNKRTLGSPKVILSIPKYQHNGHLPAWKACRYDLI